MKTLWLTAAGVLLALAPAGTAAQTVSPGGVLAPPILQPGGGSLYPGNGSLFPAPMRSQGGVRGSGRGAVGNVHHGHRGFANDVFIYEEPDVVHDVVVVHDEAAAAPEPPPPTSTAARDGTGRWERSIARWRGLRLNHAVNA
jgi:hypothetical protein